MAAPAIAAVAKKVLQVVLSNKKGRSAVITIVLIVLFLIFLPVIVFFSVISGDIDLNIDGLESRIEQHINEETQGKLQLAEGVINDIELKMTEAGYSAEDIKKAQVIYSLALYEFSDQENFTENLVGCFAAEQTDEELMSAINLKFGTNISYTEFEKVLTNIKADNTGITEDNPLTESG